MLGQNDTTPLSTKPTGRARQALDLMLRSHRPGVTALSLAGASALLGGSAEAATIYGSGPLTLTNNGTINWDIDGDSDIDVTLTDSAGSSAFCVFSSGTPSFWLENGSGDLVNVNDGTVIGPGGAYFHMGCRSFSTADCNHQHLESWQNFGLPDFGPPNATDWSGRLGFRFDNGGTTNYGVLSFDVISWDGSFGSDPTDTFRINSWAYDDTGAAISGDALNPVPEPGTIGLLLLGLGAAGIRHRRNARKG